MAKGECLQFHESGKDKLIIQSLYTLYNYLSKENFLSLSSNKTKNNILVVITNVLIRLSIHLIDRINN